MGVIDVNKMTFIDAPLVTLPASETANYNNIFIKNRAAGASTIIPHFYNKVSFLIDRNVPEMKFTTASQWANVGTIADYYNIDFGGYPRIGVNVLGRFESQINSNPFFDYPSLGDWIIYYKLEKVKNREWIFSGQISAKPSIFKVTMGATNDYFVRESPTAQLVDYTPMEETGVQKYLIAGGEDIPTPTNEYDEWYTVTEICVYNRARGSGDNRKEIHNCFPCVLWDLQNLYIYQLKNGRLELQTRTGNFQGLTKMVFYEYPANGRPHSMWQLFDWNLFQSKRIYTPVGTSTPLLTRIATHNNKNSNMVMLGATNPNNNIKIWGIDDNTRWYAPYNSSNRYEMVSIPAFKTEQDFLNLLSDWGITRVTNNLQDAQTLPAELLPDSGGGFVPSGGDSSGYDDNPVIPNIPAFPDNTSDNVEIISPNITGLNAASVYALSLTSTQNFLKWLMTDSFIDNISNLFTDKLSALNDLKLMPFDVVNHDTAHATASNQLTLANVSTEIPCYKIQAGYNCIVDGGTYQYTAYWGNFNDYTAANYYLYVPYGGIVELSPSHVVNCELSIKYAVDLMTGNATAVIYSNGVLVKTLPCQMSQPVPITFTNTNQRDIKNALTALSVVSGIGGTVANAAVGNVGGAVSSGLGVLGTIAGGIANNPLKVGSVGNFGSGTAFAMPQNAFLIISRAQLSNPSGLAEIAGRPSNIYTTISSFVGSGFVQINVSHINTAATTAEQQQIIDLLRGGIFI